MPLATCPFCHAFASMDVIPETGTALKQDRRVLQAAFECTGCGRLVLGIARQSPESDSPWVDPSRPSTISAHLDWLPDAEFQWEPARPIGRDFPDVPGVIAAPASEAVACASVGQNRAAVMMARAVIEASAKHHDVKNGSLFDKIDKLVELGKVRPLLGQAAHEVRVAGNDMAHGDFATVAVTGEDAEELLALMEDFLGELFQLPNRVANRRAKRSGGSQTEKSANPS